MLLFGIIFAGGVSRRKRITLQIMMLILTAMLLISCGGGGSGGTGTTNKTYSVSGLSSGTTYYWQVVAKDGNGGETTSDVKSFTTQ